MYQHRIFKSPFNQSQNCENEMKKKNTLERITKAKMLSDIITKLYQVYPECI